MTTPRYSVTVGELLLSDWATAAPRRQPGRGKPNLP